MNRPAGLDDRELHRNLVTRLPIGVGAGQLSDEAEVRLARPPVEPLRPPAMGDLEGVRRWRAAVHEAWLAGDPSTEECGHREVAVDGVRCLVADGPRGASPLVVYLHGGGFALGSPEIALPITDRLRRRAGITSVDYRLAPEHPFPAARSDAVTVVAALAAREQRPLVLVGDSAGAALAVTVSLAGIADIAALVLFSPHVDVMPPTKRSNRIDPSSDVDEVTARWLRRAYCGDRSPADPLISPLRADLAALPPTLLQVGAIDSSLRQAIRFARLARLAGAEVYLDVWDGMWHTWHYHRDLPEADRAIEEAGRFIERFTDRTSSC